MAVVRWMPGATTVHKDDGPAGSGVEGAPLRLGVLLSGGGRSFQNLHEHIGAGKLHAEIRCVISSRVDAYGIQRAHDAGIRSHVVSRRDVSDPEFHDLIRDRLVESDVELVCMAGFCCLWRIPPEFAGRVMNIHPALLPDFGGRGFYGAKVHAAVLASGRTTSGCTVHFCDNAYDHGPIILRREVPVRSSDTVETLGARVFEQECVAYPEAIRRYMTDCRGGGGARGSGIIAG